MRRPKIKITLVERLGSYGCHRGHKIGDAFDYDTERGKLCPMAMHVALPYIDIPRYGVLTFTIHEKSELISNWERVRIFLFMSKTWRRFFVFFFENFRLTGHLEDNKARRLDAELATCITQTASPLAV